jgi:hypothetical protein
MFKRGLGLTARSWASRFSNYLNDAAMSEALPMVVSAI